MQTMKTIHKPASQSPSAFIALLCMEVTGLATVF